MRLRFFPGISRIQASEFSPMASGVSSSQTGGIGGAAIFFSARRNPPFYFITSCLGSIRGSGATTPDG
jgi:hypothetical protein